MTPNRDTLSVEELSQRADTTVRTIRYYGTLGVLPAPTRDGRKAFYGDRHLRRLELIRTLQEHGYSLADIDRWLRRHADGDTQDDLAVERAMLASWHPRAELVRDVDALSERAGRELDDQAVRELEVIGAVVRHEDGWELQPSFDIGVRLLGLDLPLDGIEAANDAIRAHMLALARELTEIVGDQVVRPFRASRPNAEEAERFAEAMVELRQLTLEAIAVAFRRAANEVLRDGLP